jgi:hypothetical protein
MDSKAKRPASAGARSSSRHDDADAFVADPKDGPGRVNDDLAEELAEGFVETATSGDPGDDESLDATAPEDIGGPFVPTGATEELADDADASNPRDATREPLPRATAADPTSASEADEIDETDGLRAPAPEHE